jgi:disulfide oxidoreductase YuzD
VERRFGGAAALLYLDTASPEVRSEHSETVARIQDEGLVYPVTFVNGEPVYDGAVSHAVILRSIQVRLGEAGKEGWG